MNRKDFDCVSLEEVQNPKDGDQVIKDHWWIVTPENEVLFYIGKKYNYSPQCNSDKKMTAYMQKKIYPECHIQHIPLAYMRIPREIETRRIDFEREDYYD